MSATADGFSRICDENGICHCDWRLTIYGCEEEVHMRPFYISLAAISGVIGASACALLYHRKVNLSQSIFNWRTGILRPKPIESLIMFGAIFNLLQMIHAIIMVTDAAPNVAFRSFLFEVPWHYGIGAFACYLFGIAHTISESNRIIYDRWVGTPVVVNIITIIFLFGPHVTNNICSIASGIYGLRGDVYHAERYTNALYWLWAFYTGCLGILILYAGIRLLGLLRRHLLERKSDIAIENVKLGILKVKILVAAGTSCLLLFVIMMIIYASRRVSIILVTEYNVTLACIWMLNGAMATSVIFFGIILNPRMATLANNFGSTDDDCINDPPQPATAGGGANSIGNLESGHGKWTLNAVGALDADKGIISRNWNIDDMDTTISSEKPDQIEVDQLHYNAMTNMARAKLPRNTFEDNHRYLQPDSDRYTLSSTSYLTDNH
ncbi:hypothetical protein BX666DRAFT_1893461 [Dichotomocladium elegans]|nr:hypothetical protein BX666DRAFT_1893461 [Dichotomocladium elegans]